MTTAKAPPRPSNGTGRKTFGVSRGVTRGAYRATVYGTGGIGKSSLVSSCEGVIFADLERSTEDLDVRRVDGVENWADLRAWLQTGDFSDVKTIAIDSATKAEEWCARHVIQTVPHDKGCVIKGLEDYGFGKGYVHVFEEWRRLLTDLEIHYRAGRNIVLIAHDINGKNPNPEGEDFLCHQPRLQHSEKASVMLATKEWCDHVLFIGYDTAVKNGKAKGEGSRTIYLSGTPTVTAKSRGISDAPIPFIPGGRELWDRLEGKDREVQPAAPEVPAGL